jgi:hypothetical protein
MGRGRDAAIGRACRTEGKAQVAHYGDERNLILAFDADDPKDKAATDILLAMQLEIDKHHFRLRGIRARQLTRR